MNLRGREIQKCEIVGIRHKDGSEAWWLEIEVNISHRTGWEKDITFTCDHYYLQPVDHDIYRWEMTDKPTCFHRPPKLFPSRELAEAAWKEFTYYETVKEMRETLFARPEKENDESRTRI